MSSEKWEAASYSDNPSSVSPLKTLQLQQSGSLRTVSWHSVTVQWRVCYLLPFSEEMPVSGAMDDWSTLKRLDIKLHLLCKFVPKQRCGATIGMRDTGPNFSVQQPTLTFCLRNTGHRTPTPHQILWELWVWTNCCDKLSRDHQGPVTTLHTVLGSQARVSPVLGFKPLLWAVAGKQQLFSHFSIASPLSNWIFGSPRIFPTVAIDISSFACLQTHYLKEKISNG